MKRKTIRLVAAFVAKNMTVSFRLCGDRCTGKPTKKETLVIGSDIYSPYFCLDNNGDFAGIDAEIAGEA